ncbi:MAG: glycosyltransferase family 4 protein [Acidobacteriales bacterium]|nr:glycosyltransferase family 4 protein [Terriglobales bacterium]
MNTSLRAAAPSPCPAEDSAAAFLANEFPSPVEPYVVDQVVELRARGVCVTLCSVRRPHFKTLDAALQPLAAETIYLLPLQPRTAARATWLLLTHFFLLADLFRALTRGPESLSQRIRAVAHTWLGAYLAVLLQRRGVRQIHVHHGYFGSWIGMVAARLLGAGFSLTLHGSDMLLHPAFLDAKLQASNFCVTISDYNRNFLLRCFPDIDPHKIHTIHLGVPVPAASPPPDSDKASLALLAVGRLHPVKDHAFLLRTLSRWKKRGRDFTLKIAGEGPEHLALAWLIADLRLEREVELLGHVPHAQLATLYSQCDAVVLTSRSEGIPLVLMEAMANARIVIAPRITGIPELVRDGDTGFLYVPHSPDDLQEKLDRVVRRRADPTIGLAARQHVIQHFEHGKNLIAFAETFLSYALPQGNNHSYEDPLLQQVQLSI